MRLLLFSDLHSDLAAARRIAQQSADVDVLVGAGDYCNVHRGLRECLELLRAPAVLVAGNNETTEELADACSGWPDAHVLHGSGTTIGRFAFYGLGGGVPVTPFGAWSYDLTESEAGRLLSACPTGGVLISHSPPKDALDVSSRGQSLGSIAVRTAVERCRPALVVCGHIHACAGQQTRLGSSIVVNAGPGGIEWTL